MPCLHKFIECLRLEKLDFEPTTLIVGTFNPAWPVRNQAQWFYGRTARNYFWEVLPTLYNEPNLRKANPTIWKQFCKKHKIAITDLISSIGDANYEQHSNTLGKYRDIDISKFKNIEENSILDFLEKYPSIKNVYLTTQARIPFFNNLWVNIETSCLKLGLHQSRLITPSSGARFQIPRSFIPQSNLQRSKTASFIYEDWKPKWHRLK